jgi:hypothetical protein
MMKDYKHLKADPRLMAPLLGWKLAARIGLGLIFALVVSWVFLVLALGA